MILRTNHRVEATVEQIDWQCFGLVFGWLVFDILFRSIIIHSLPDANVKHVVVLFVAGWVVFFDLLDCDVPSASAELTD